MLTAGHARTLVAADDPQALAERIVKLGLSVREAEDLARRPAEQQPAQEQGPGHGLAGQGRQQQAEKDPNVRALEDALSQALGFEVAVEDRGRAGGRVVIRYRTLEQLDEILRQAVAPGRGLPSALAAGQAPSAARQGQHRPFGDCSLERRALPGGGDGGVHGLGGGLQRGGIPEAELAPQAGLAVEKTGGRALRRA